MKIIKNISQKWMKSIEDLVQNRKMKFYIQQSISFIGIIISILQVLQKNNYYSQINSSNYNNNDKNNIDLQSYFKLGLLVTALLFNSFHFMLSFKIIQTKLLYKVSQCLSAQIVLETYFLSSNEFGETQILIINIIQLQIANQSDQNSGFGILFQLSAIIYTFIRLIIVETDYSQILITIFIQICLIFYIAQCHQFSNKNKLIYRLNTKKSNLNDGANNNNKTLQAEQCQEVIIEIDNNNINDVQEEYNKLQQLINVNDIQQFQTIDFKTIRSKTSHFQPLQQKNIFSENILNQFIFDNLSTGVAVFSNEGRLISYNETLKTFFKENINDKVNIEDDILEYKFKNLQGKKNKENEENLQAEIQKTFRKQNRSHSYTIKTTQQKLKKDNLFQSLKVSLNNTRLKKRGATEYQENKQNSYANLDLSQSMNQDQSPHLRYLLGTKDKSDNFLLNNYQTKVDDSQTIRVNLGQSSTKSKMQNKNHLFNVKQVQTYFTQSSNSPQILNNLLQSNYNDNTAQTNDMFKCSLFSQNANEQQNIRKPLNFKWKKYNIQQNEDLLKVLKKSQFTIKDIIQQLLSNQSQKSERKMRSERQLSSIQPKKMKSHTNFEKDSDTKSTKTLENHVSTKCFKFLDMNTLILRQKTPRGETLFKISSFVKRQNFQQNNYEYNESLRQKSFEKISSDQQNLESSYAFKQELQDEDEEDEIAILIELKDITNILTEKESEDLKMYKNKMLASLSHELRTPLNCSIQLIEALYQSGLLKEEDKSMFLVPAIQSNQLLLHIINDILDFAQINNGDLKLIFTDFDVRKVIQECIQLFGLYSFQKGLPIELIIDPKLPRTTRSDITRFKQVLLNLLSNAIKFTSQGQIIIQVEYCAENKKNQSNYLKVSIQDTGCGIDPKLGNSIFDGFNRESIPNKKNHTRQISQEDGVTKTNTSINKKENISINSLNFSITNELIEDNNEKNLNTVGAGLGLSIAQNLAKGLGSNRGIEFISKLNKGSTFTFFVTDRPTTTPGCMLNRRSIFNIQYLNWQTMSSFSNHRLSKNSSSLLQNDQNNPKSFSIKQGGRISDISLPDQQMIKNKGNQNVSLNLSLSAYDIKPKQNQSKQKMSLAVSDRTISEVSYDKSRIKRNYEEMDQQQLNQLRKWYQDIEKQVQASYYALCDSESQLDSNSVIEEEEDCIQQASSESFSYRRDHLNHQNQFFKKASFYLLNNIPQQQQQQMQWKEYLQQMQLEQQNQLQQIPQKQSGMLQKIPQLFLQKQSSSSNQSSGSISISPDKHRYSISEGKNISPSRFAIRSSQLIPDSPIKNQSPKSKKKYNEPFNFQIKMQQQTIIETQQQLQEIAFEAETLQKITLLKNDSTNLQELSENKIEQQFSNNDYGTSLSSIKNQLKNENGSEKSAKSPTNVQVDKPKEDNLINKQQLFLNFNKDNSNTNSQNKNNIPDNNNELRVINKDNSKTLSDKQINLSTIKDLIKLKSQQNFTCSCTNILIVDDNDFNLYALELRLKTYGLKIEKANSGNLALQKVKDKYNSQNCCKLYSLIFMDIDMPVKNGYETTQDIISYFNKEKIPKPPPISACTAYVSEQERKKATESGMKYYITKPVDSFSLEDVLKQIFLK